MTNKLIAPGVIKRGHRSSSQKLPSMTIIPTEWLSLADAIARFTGILGDVRAARSMLRTHLAVGGLQACCETMVLDIACGPIPVTPAISLLSFKKGERVSQVKVSRQLWRKSTFDAFSLFDWKILVFARITLAQVITQDPETGELSQTPNMRQIIYGVQVRRDQFEALLEREAQKVKKKKGTRGPRGPYGKYDWKHLLGNLYSQIEDGSFEKLHLRSGPNLFYREVKKSIKRYAPEDVSPQTLARQADLLIAAWEAKETTRNRD